jgi:hypothetical protein
MTPQPKQPPIFTLPLDLLLELKDHLDIENLVCFSLTCKALYKTLFPKNVWKPSLRSAGIPNLQFLGFGFLILLARDLPETFLCQRCEYTLHQMNNRMIGSSVAAVELLGYTSVGLKKVVKVNMAYCVEKKKGEWEEKNEIGKFMA